MRPQGSPAAWAVGQRVRYKPGIGTYGLEDALGRDGRIGGVVVGHTAQRVRLELTFEAGVRAGTKYRRSVDAASLIAAEETANV